MPRLGCNSVAVPPEIHGPSHSRGGDPPGDVPAPFIARSLSEHRSVEHCQNGPKWITTICIIYWKPALSVIAPFNVEVG